MLGYYNPIENDVTGKVQRSRTYEGFKAKVSVSDDVIKAFFSIAKFSILYDLLSYFISNLTLTKIAKISF